MNTKYETVWGLMSREDIIRMAREAGFVIDEASRQYQPKCIGFTHYLIDDELERFAALIASRVAAASASVEREACAQVCEAYTDNDEGTFIDNEGHGYECAAAIRARGEATSRGQE